MYNGRPKMKTHSLSHLISFRGVPCTFRLYKKLNKEFIEEFEELTKASPLHCMTINGKPSNIN